MRLLHHARGIVDSVYSRPQSSDAGRKPDGFWVSVEGEMSWKEWCESEDWGLDRFDFDHEIVLSNDANILHLCDIGQIDRFHKEYSECDNARFDSELIKWNRVAEDYQGIIIAPYQWDRRLDGKVSDWYYGWDCASGCIWDETAIHDIQYERAAA